MKYNIGDKVFVPYKFSALPNYSDYPVYHLFSEIKIKEILITKNGIFYMDENRVNYPETEISSSCSNHPSLPAFVKENKLLVENLEKALEDAKRNLKYLEKLNA